ncbi:MAG: TonB-dependent receptor, partial [Gammaproteobacteria bacterium]|nr:TonB-dependent receptor [Gammaproteobacteria bacterium]
MFRLYKSSYILLALSLAVFSFDTIAQSLLEEIIVTARKRDESYTDVPVSVTAFTEADIESAGIESPADFIARTPNITMVETQNQGTSFITIRG